MFVIMRTIAFLSGFLSYFALFNTPYIGVARWNTTAEFSRLFCNTNFAKLSYKQCRYILSMQCILLKKFSLHRIVRLLCPKLSHAIHSLRPGKTDRHFAANISNKYLLMKMSINISLKFVSNDAINNILELVQRTACRRAGDKPLSD